MPPEASQALIRSRAKAAIEGLRGMKPFVVPAPIQLELTYKNYTPAEMMAYLPGVERVDSHTIRYVGKSIIDVSRFMGFAMGYRADLTP
jgi:D-amino peptidase